MLRAEQWFVLWQWALVQYHFVQNIPIDEAKKKADYYVNMMQTKAICLAIQWEPGDRPWG